MRSLVCLTVASPGDMRHLSSPNRDQTLTPYIGRVESIFFNLLIYLFLTALGLRCSARASSSCVSRGHAPSQCFSSCGVWA